MAILARGNYSIKRVANQRNLLNWQTTWKEAELPPGWVIYGVAKENSIVLQSNPFGSKSLLWKCTPDTTEASSGGAAGGYARSPYVMLDDIHTYRYTVFVYREKASKGYIYHGCMYCDNLNGTTNGNPYFYAGNLPVGQWHMIVGHIHPSKADNSWQLSTSGVYNMTGKKIASGTDYKLRNPNVNISLRSFLNGTNNPEDVAYLYNPILEVCDGNELSIEQLLQVSTRDEIDTVKSEVSTSITQLKSSISLKAEKTEVSALNTRVSAAEAKITPDAIRLTVKSQTETIVNNAVDGIEIGGRNLLEKSNIEKTGANEYLSYANVTSCFDKLGAGQYVISFDLKLSSAGSCNFYSTPGNESDFKYVFSPSYTIQATTEYVRHSFVVNVRVANPIRTNSALAFYATYGTGRIPSVKNVKIERGNKGTDWTPAPEDIAADTEAVRLAAVAAQTKANEASTAASTAQTTANNAVANANTANNLLADIANDNKFTAQEKQATKKEWDAIISEKPLNDASADKFAVSKTAYGTAYTALNTYLTPLLSNLATTQDIVGTTFRSTFKTYYNARTNLLNAISTAAKALADAAQTKANAASAAAGTAQSKADAASAAAGAAQTSANNAASTANAAKLRLDNWSADGSISPTEKLTLKQEQKALLDEKIQIVADALKYAVSSTAYVTAYTNYNGELTYHATSTPEIIAIRANFATYQTAYYTAKQTILNAISVAAKKYAEDKANDAKQAAINDAANKYPTKTELSSSIEVLSTQIASKVSQSDFNSLGQQVKSAETSIIQQAKQISLSASKLELDSLTGKVTSIESELNVHAGEISMKVTAADVSAGMTITPNKITMFGKEFDLTGKFTFSSMAPDAQGKINDAQKTANKAVEDAADALTTSRNNIAAQLGYGSYGAMSAAAAVGKTIINGGKIRTELLDATAIVTSVLAATNVTATNLTVTGNSNIGGMVIRDGKLTGGSMVITDGALIGGLKVSGNGLTNEGFNNDAYIVLRNDNKGTFVGIGGNVMPSGVGTRAAGRFECEGNQYGLSNTALVLLAKGAIGSGARNIALDIQGEIIIRPGNGEVRTGQNLDFMIEGVWVGARKWDITLQVTNGLITSYRLQ